MDKLTIITNNVARDVLYWWDLTEKEQAEFDYLDSESLQCDARFVRYRGWCYDLGEFMATQGMPEFSPLVAWQGYQSDSFFSGVLLRYSKDFESVVMGRYFS